MIAGTEANTILTNLAVKRVKLASILAQDAEPTDLVSAIFEDSWGLCTASQSEEENSALLQASSAGP